MNWMPIISMYILLTVILVCCIYQIIKEIKAQINKGKLLLIFKREINRYLILGEIYILFILFMGEKVWVHNNTSGFALSSIILFTLLMVYYFYKGLRKQGLYENVIIASDGIYHLDRIHSYEWSDIVELDGIVVLTIKVEDKLLFRKEKFREIQFRLEKDKMDIIENTIAPLR